MQIGLDLVENQRIAAAYEKHGERFCRRFLSDKEMQQFYSDYQESISYLASRWAAKEALYKAYQGKKSWTWVCQFSVLAQKEQPPRISHPDFPRCDFISLSLSHEKNMAICMVLLQT
tara:strand:+ start:5840 stop:6190 length:351 start_codon:yes stop_codon:yes gene_type:complete